jgi:Tfp pilus assembly protein PilZ
LDKIRFVSSEPRRLELHFDSWTDLETEYEGNFKHGRALVKASDDLVLGECCHLVLHHPDDPEELALSARIVALVPSQNNAGAESGVGVEFLDFDDDAAEALHGFVFSAEGSDGQRAAEGTQQTFRAVALPTRLKDLPIGQQIKLAQTGNLDERVLLERRHGKTVWEGLLRNPRITVPEVARIARKGTVPQILLDLIVDNASWVRSGPVRRALLSNPRLSVDQVQRVLRHTPKAELKVIVKTGAYPHAVRDAARKLV